MPDARGVLKRKPMIAAVIQARMGSTRLPGKVLLDLAGKPVLWHVASRTLRARGIDRVVVATTLNSEDDAIARFCEGEGIEVCRGSEDDVLDRYYRCAEALGADTIVRITADCPLHDPQVIDDVIRVYNRGGYDYVSNILEYSYPDGLDVEVFSFGALEKAWSHARLRSEREHVTPYIRNSPACRKKNVTARRRYPGYRLTLDTAEDYALIRAVYDGIGRPFFTLDETVAFLDMHPDIAGINTGIMGNEGYLRSLVQDAKESTVEGERIFLRPLREDDATPEYAGWLSDPEVNRFLETKGSTLDELRAYIRGQAENPASVFYGIFLRTGGKHIGNIKLEPILFHRKEATIGILIGERECWGKGYCTEAVKLLVSWAFSKLSLDRIQLGVVTENRAAVRCYEKAGFGIDERVPLTGVNAGHYREKYMMSIRNPSGSSAEP